MEKFLLGFREARKAKHLLDSFLNSFRFLVVNIDQCIIDLPAARVCVTPCVCYIAVHDEGGACASKFVNTQWKHYQSDLLNKGTLLLSLEYISMTKNVPLRSMFIYCTLFSPWMERTRTHDLPGCLLYRDRNKLSNVTSLRPISPQYQGHTHCFYSQ